MKKDRLEPFAKLNRKYNNLWLKNCPPKGNVKVVELKDNSYLKISQNDLNIYKNAGKVWQDEIPGFAKSEGYIKEDNGCYYLTKIGRLAKSFGGHENYKLYRKFNIKDKYPILFSVGLIVFGSFLTVITSRLTNQSKQPELPPIYMYQNARIEALHDSVKTLQLHLNNLLDSLKR